MLHYYVNVMKADFPQFGEYQTDRGNGTYLFGTSVYLLSSMPTYFLGFNIQLIREYKHYLILTSGSAK